MVQQHVFWDCGRPFLVVVTFGGRFIEGFFFNKKMLVSHTRLLGEPLEAHR